MCSVSKVGQMEQEDQFVANIGIRIAFGLAVMIDYQDRILVIIKTKSFW